MLLEMKLMLLQNMEQVSKEKLVQKVVNFQEAKSKELQSQELFLKTLLF